MRQERFEGRNLGWRSEGEAIATVAEWLRRLTRNQIPFGSAASNPAGCEQVLRRSIGYQVGFLCGVRKTKRVQSVRLAEWSKA